MLENLKRLWWVPVVAGALGVSAIASRQTTSPADQELLNLLKQTTQTQQQIAAKIQDVEAEVQNTSGYVEQQQATRVLNEATAKFQAFDDAGYELLTALVQERAMAIYLELSQESEQSGDSLEILLHRRLVHLEDRAFALATQHNGRIRMEDADQEMFDTAMGQIGDTLAIAHLLERLSYAQPPVANQADFSQLPATVKGLGRLMFELNAQRQTITDLAKIQRIDERRHHDTEYANNDQTR